jgi:hypothetical protein
MPFRTFSNALSAETQGSGTVAVVVEIIFYLPRYTMPPDLASRFLVNPSQNLPAKYGQKMTSFG